MPKGRSVNADLEILREHSIKEAQALCTGTTVST